MAVESGEVATKSILERLEYMASLTQPRDLSWLGIDAKITPLDKETFLFIRDNPVFSSVKRIADHGVAHQYGKVLLEGNHAPESLVGAASAISVVQETDSGDIQIYRKKQFGIEDKHGKQLISKFYNVKEKAKQTETQPPKTGYNMGTNAITDVEAELIEEEEKPELATDRTVIQMKMEPITQDVTGSPWELKGEEELPELIKPEEKPPLKMRAHPITEQTTFVPWGTEQKQDKQPKQKTAKKKMQQIKRLANDRAPWQ